MEQHQFEVWKEAYDNLLSITLINRVRDAIFAACCGVVVGSLGTFFIMSH